MQVEAGERLRWLDVASTRPWMVASSSDLTGLFSEDDKRPAHPPSCLIEFTHKWLFIGRGDGGGVVERRDINSRILEDFVVVFREGVALPTRTLLRVVNSAHAVLVLRGERYFYLRHDLALPTGDEEALVAWGVARPLLANSFLAVGGTLLVALAEKVWGPAVVGTLLVAAAGYRVQGALTKVLRVRSPEWKSKYMLVPSGIHGTEGRCRACW